MNIVKFSFAKRFFLGVAVLVGLSLLPSGHVYAVNSGVLDITATVNSTLGISVANTNAQAFDPSQTNVGVKVGELTVSANIAVTNKLQITLYRSNLGNPDYSALHNLLLVGPFGATQNYTLRLTPSTGPGFSSTPGSGSATTYGSSWTLNGSLSSSSMKYHIFINTTAKVLLSGQYKDSVIFNLVSI